MSYPGADLRSTVESYIAGHQSEIFVELVKLLSIPNVAANKADIERNAEFLCDMLERRGMTAEILPTQGNPLVYGERRIAGAKRTMLFYAHYDGQPVDPARWKTGQPFRPVLFAGKMEEGAKVITSFPSNSMEPGWRLYGRSASDDKAPIVALCTALDALKAAGRGPGSNLRVVLDGEEEAGSLSMNAAVDRYREKLQADVMIILDGPLHPSGRPTLNFGARGIVTLGLTVYGPKFALHSGHYGNWVPNPAMRLAQLLATMKDEQGRVLIRGFNQGIPRLKAEELRLQKEVPDDLERLKRLFGIAETDAVGSNLQEALQFPSLNVRGLRSAYVGADARTVIPADATAELDIRLVKETPSAQMVEKVLAHIRKEGYHIVDQDPDDATRLKYPRLIRVTQHEATEAYRSEMDLPECVAVTEAVKRVWGIEPIRIRTSGGTVPISQFIRRLGFPAVSVPIVNFDNNQHGENENLRLGHLWNGIVTISALIGN